MLMTLAKSSYEGVNDQKQHAWYSIDSSNMHIQSARIHSIYVLQSLDVPLASDDKAQPMR